MTRSTTHSAASPATRPDAKDIHPERAKLDEESRIDEDLEETFPASDATVNGGVTKIGRDGEEKGDA
jgi:hypothetical protein